MATFVAAANSPESLTSSHTVTKPDGVVSGDIGVFFLSFWNSGGTFPTVTAPTGAVLRVIVASTGDGEVQHNLFLIYTGTESDYTFSWSGGEWSAVHAQFFTGVDQGLDLAAVPLDTAAGVGTAIATTTVTTQNGAALAWSNSTHAYPTDTTHEPPTGYTETADESAMATAYRISPSDGSQSASGATRSTSEEWTAILAALAPAATGGGDVTGALSATLPALTGSLTGNVETPSPAGALDATLPVLTAALTGTSDAVTGPFVAGVSGLHFIDGDGDPIQVKGDTVWAFPVNAGRWNGGDWQADFDAYLAARSSQGYNALYHAVLGSTQNNGPSNDGATFDGILPFVSGEPGDFNEPYWARVDYMLAQAQARGITVFLNWAYSDDLDNAALSGKTNTQLTAYGAALATRYQTRPNLVWMVGGDYFGVQDDRVTAVLDGIRSTGDTRPQAIQYYPETTSRRDLETGNTQSWGEDNAQFDFMYSYNVTYVGADVMHTVPSPRTPLWGDGTYDNDTAADRRIFRQLVWWAFSSGVRGYIYGAEGIWGWGSGALAQVQSSASGFADVDLPVIRSAFESLDGWHLLIPDTDSSLVTSGRGTYADPLASGGGGGEYDGDPQDTFVSASITPDGSLAVIYLPVVTTITVDDTELVSGYTATWIDPADGTATPAIVSGSYTNPGTNSLGDDDWVLALQAPTDVTGTIAATLPTLTGQLTGLASVAGEVVAILPAPTGNLAGTVTIDVTGGVAATLPALTGHLTGLSGDLTSIGTPVPTPTGVAGTTALGQVTGITALGLVQGDTAAGLIDAAIREGKVETWLPS